MAKGTTSFRLTEDELKRLDNIARLMRAESGENVTRTDVVQMLIRAANNTTPKKKRAAK